MVELTIYEHDISLLLLNNGRPSGLFVAWAKRIITGLNITDRYLLFIYYIYKYNYNNS